MSPWKPKRILFIINRRRRSQGPPAPLLEQFHALLCQARLAYTLKLSDSVEHSHELINQGVDEGCDTLWIGGGDGTINQLVDFSLVMSNICNYVGFGVLREQQCCSPFMELHLFRRNRLWPLVRWYHAMRLGSGRWEGPATVVSHFHLKECVVRSEEPLALQVDGEAVNSPNPRELHFRSLPRAIRLLL